MNLHGALSSIDVVVHSEPAEWWQVLAALTPLATLLVFVFVLLMLRRPATEAGSETPAERWSRAEWALDMALDHNPKRQKVGLAVLDQLSTDRLVGKEEAHILAQARALLNKSRSPISDGHRA